MFSKYQRSYQHRMALKLNLAETRRASTLPRYETQYILCTKQI